MKTLRARTMDPETSHEAAESVRNVTTTHEYVLRALRRPRTDPELLEAYRQFKRAPRASESGIRSRRAELVRAGLVRDSKRRVRLESGRRAIVWEKTS